MVLEKEVCCSFMSCSAENNCCNGIISWSRHRNIKNYAQTRTWTSFKVSAIRKADFLPDGKKYFKVRGGAALAISYYLQGVSKKVPAVISSQLQL